MSYYQFSRQEILQKAKENYSKEKAARYYYYFFYIKHYTCKHKIYNHQSYIYLLCLGIKKPQTTTTKKNNNNKNKN